MADMLKRRYITLEMFKKNKTQTYSGRLIGLIDEKEFAKVISSKVVQARIATGETMPLTEIAEGYDDLNNMRMVVSLRKVGEELVIGKRLLITERLGLISAMSRDKKELSITGDKGTWMVVSEEEAN